MEIANKVVEKAVRAANAAWSAERVEPGNERELLGFHVDAFARNPTPDRLERIARIVESEARKGLLAKHYAPGNATSELLAAVRRGREMVKRGEGDAAAAELKRIVDGLRRVGANSTNPVVANAMRAALNWSAFGGADGQVVTMPIPKSDYGKSDLDFLVEWARKNSADLAKYYTPSNVASKVIALAEKAKRKIDETTKRRQSEADAKFGTGIGRVRVPEAPLKKTEPEIAEIRSILAGIKQIPSASKEAQKRDAAIERRQRSRTQRYYDTHPDARD